MLPDVVDSADLICDDKKEKIAALQIALDYPHENKPHARAVLEVDEPGIDLRVP